MLHDLLISTPIGIPALMGLLLLVLDVVQTGSGGGDRRYLGYLTVVGMAAGLLAVYLLWGREGDTSFSTAAFGTMLVMGKFELAACAVLLLIGAIVALISVDYAEEQDFSFGELYALINFAIFGMMILVSAVNMVTLFLGLEIMSIAVYILAAIKRSSAFAAEAGFKYFILGAFSSGILMFGVAYLYGETRSFEYAAILAALQSGPPSAYLAIAVVMLTTAFAFKMALVPFHMWTPDVYEGAPTSVTALMATGVKTAAVVSMGRVLVMALPASALGWLGVDLVDVLGIVAVATMTVGNLIAIQQHNIKRMLAYSSIAHAGYLLIGLMAAHLAAGPGNELWGTQMSSVLFYLLTYALANLGAFAVVAMLGKNGVEDVDLDHVSGLAKVHPIGAFVLAVSMLSLAGSPPTAGFFGKLVLFRDALAVDPDRFLWLVVVAMLNSVVSVYYYLRVVVYAYMREPVRDVLIIRGRALGVALLLTVFGSLQLGLFPAKTLKAFEEAGAAFVPVAQRTDTSAKPVEAAALQSAPGSAAMVPAIPTALDAPEGPSKALAAVR